MTRILESIVGVASEVPYLVLPPANDPAGAPVVIAWHLLDAPRTEVALASALPMADLNAWRIYLGLPLTGARMPAGGPEEVMRLGYEDAVLNLYGPIYDQATTEFLPAYQELQRELGFRDGPIGVLGGSQGAAVAQGLLASSPVPIGAAVLVSPLIRLQPVVEAVGRSFGIDYQWSPESLAVAAQIDFVARAGELAARNAPVLLVVGEDDDEAAIRQPAEALQANLAKAEATVDLFNVPGMAHAFAAEPGTEPAPQTAHAAIIDRQAVDWFHRQLNR